MSNHILVVEDEKELADILELYLTNDGYTVSKYYNGTQALACIEHTAFDLAILDVMLPDADGFAILRKIRETSYYPVIMLTARTAREDKIMGLTIGADDYITKPFHPSEVMARVRTQLRRYLQYSQYAPRRDAADAVQEYEIRGLLINQDTHKCFLYGKELPLTPIEFSILWYLCAHQGSVIPSEELFEAVWGEKFLKNNNTVMAHIGRLREKMDEPPRNPKFVKTVWGVGYTIEK
ncbi:MAG: VanR-ABDEGLN family response regulator transcription factor [Eubacterium sp.]|nr:VanR-ABDEGLN family response regulator transcription factor [Eubacterium sp.]